MIQGFKLIFALVIGLLTANVVNAAVITGNPNGQITVEEFFDYQCPHCREMAQHVNQAIKSNQNVRVVSRVIPIMDGSSWFIARAALAARKQKGFHKFNALLMQEENYISKEQTLQLAKIAGLDLKRLQKDMHDSEISAELNANLRASQAQGINVVPATIVSHKAAKHEPVKIIGDKSVSYLEGLFKEL